MMDKAPVRHICKKSVPTILVDDSVAKAIALLESTRSSAVVVVDKTFKPVGIITERDVTRQAGHWDEIISQPVDQLMSSPLVTLDEETDFRDAYLQMTQSGFRHMVVTDADDKLTGVIDEGDFLKHLTSEQLLAVKEVHLVMSKEVATLSAEKLVSETIALMTSAKISSVVITDARRPLGIFTERDAVHLAKEGDKVLAEPISKYMSSPIRTIHEGHSVMDAEKILEAGNIRRLVVVDEAGDLVGILTQHDLVKGISGIYVEMLRETIREQSDILNDSLVRLEEHSVLNNMLDSISDKLIIACDRAGVIQYTNATHFPCFTTLPEKGEILDERVSCFDGTISQAVLDSEIKTLSNHISTFIDEHGVRHVFKTTYAPIFSSIKILQGVMFTAEDITHEQERQYELQKAKTRLEQSEVRFRTIFDNAQNGIIVTKTDDMTVYMVNDAACEMFGYSQEEITGLTIMDLHPAEVLARAKDGFERFGKGEVSKLQEIACLRKDGSLFFADISAEPMLFDGESYLVGVIHDQTEHVDHQKILETKNLELREREKQLLQAQDIAKIGNWSLDIESMQADWSEEICRTFGLSDVADVGPELLSTIVFPEEWPSVEASLQRAIEDGTEHQMTYRVKRPSDDGMRWVDCRAIRVEDEDGQTKRLVGTLQDITERKRQEEEVNRLHAMLDALVSGSTDAIFIKDKEGRYLLCNQAVADMFGKSIDEIIGRDDEALIPERYAKQYLADDLHIMKEGKTTTYVEALSSGDGELPLLTTKGPLVIDGVIEGVFGIARDISVLNQSQNALKESENRYRSFIEQTTEGIYSFESDEPIAIDLPIEEQIRRIYGGNIVACNDALAKMYGHNDASELLGMSLTQFHGSDDDPENIAFLSEWIKNDYRISDTISSEVDKDGNPIWFSNSVVGIVEDGDLISVWGSQVDITKRKSAEQKVKEQEELMIVQSRQAAMGEMINMIAHQWRQPLSVVSMAANNLLMDMELEELSDEGIKTQLTTVHEQVQYMSQTIDDFRNFFRRSNMLEMISMGSLIDEVLAIIRPSMISSAIAIEVDCDPAIIVKTYKSELIQVIINILANAKDALRNKRSDKTIQIAVDELGSDVSLSISDNGPGVPKEMLDKVFEPYFTTKEKSGGTGLGLYMSKAIMEKHMQGSIKVRNREQGAEFLMTFAKELKAGD